MLSPGHFTEGRLAILLDSGLLDYPWYRKIAELGDLPAVDAARHYLAIGLPAGRGPNADIDRLLGAAGSPGTDAHAEAIGLISRSPDFDSAFYLEHNPDVARVGSDPATHFHDYGWKEFRNPSGSFDVWWYSRANLSRAARTVNPLLHFVLLGERLGLESLPPIQAARAGLYHESGSVRRICLFAGHDIDGVIDDYVVRYVRELSRHADVYYLADCGMGAGELEKLAGHVKGAWARRHGGYDFGSWSLLAHELVGWETISGYDELLLVNDSCYLLRPLDGVFEKMDATACDWWGLQATKRDFVDAADGAALPSVQKLVDRFHEAPHESRHVDSLHVSSYFVAYRRPVIADRGFRDLLDSVAQEQDKSRIILRYEIGGSRYLLTRGHRLATWVDHLHPYHPVYTDTAFSLIRGGFPVLKRLLLSENPLKIAKLSIWKERLLELVPDAPVEEMERNLLRVADQGKLQQSFGVEVGKDGIARPPAMLDAAEFRAADLETPTFDHWWAFPVCAYDNLLTGNERAVFEQVRDDPSIKKIVLTRRRRVDLGGRNVVVCPLDSPQGQYHLLRSGQIFVKHSPSINAKWPLSPTLHNFINLWHGIPLKRFGPASLDMDQKLDWVYRENRSCRAVISSSKVDALAMAAAFYPLPYRDVWITGLPRNDFIVCSRDRLPADLQAEGRRLEGELAGRKLVLFAPTFRNAQADGCYRFDGAELAWLRGWLEANDAVLGVREHMADSAHAYHAQLLPLGALDLSSKRYPNIEVLYRQSAVLVTDYSSCAIDFMLTGRPAISFAYDLEQYAGAERGLFYDLDHVFPGPVCRNFAELAEALDVVTRSNVPDRAWCWRLRFFFDHVDDGAARRVVDRVKAFYVGHDVACVARTEAA